MFLTMPCLAALISIENNLEIQETEIMTIHVHVDVTSRLGLI